MKSNASRPFTLRSACRIALLYAVISVAYVLCSDHLLGLYLNDVSVLTPIAILKGIGFVLVSAFLIFLLLRREMRKHAEAENALRESRHRATDLSDLIEKSSQPFLIAYPDGRMGQCNPAFLQLLGYGRDELGRLDWLKDLTPPEWHERNREVVERLYRTGRPQRFEKEYRRKDGSKVPVEMLFHLHRKKDGQLEHYAFIQDISERKRAEEDLAIYEQMIASSQDAMCLVGKDYAYRMANEAYLQKVGLDLKSILGRTVAEVFGRQFFESVIQSRLDRCFAGEAVSYAEWFDYPVEGRRYAQVNLSPCRNRTSDVIGAMVIARDITKELEMEQHYRDAQKMQAVGTLAAGIAHDFNNILGLIVGNAEMLQLTGAVAGPSAESVKQILSAAMRARNTVKQILTLSRRGRQEKIPFNLKPLIKETAEFLRSSLPPHIQLVTDLAPDAGTVSADPGQMQQVLMNLCTNAAQAMDENGGQLAIRLANTTRSREHIKLYENPVQEDLVRISVSDGGPGIDPGTLERIFEPYFTTREVGKGQGLGLSVVHGIVTSHGGSITVDTQVGRGTTFHVFLPRIRAEAQTLSAPLQKLQAGNERILFIDDEKALARVGEMTLRHLGYQVNTQNSPVAALEVFRSNPGAFDLVITDLTMPQLTGIKLAAELHQIRPGLPVILCTGYTEKINAHEAGRIGIRDVLIKPVTIRDLANSVRSALDGLSAPHEISLSSSSEVDGGRS